MQLYINRLAEGITRSLAATALFVLTLMCIRTGFAICNGCFGAIFTSGNNGTLMLLNALRFDLQASAYCAIPLLATTMVSCISARVSLSRLNAIIVCIVVTLSTAIGITDIIYYGHFASHLGSTLFTFFDEEPLVLLRGIWDESPVVVVLAVVTAVSWLSWRVARMMTAKISFVNRRLSWAVSVAGVLALALAMRGNISTFPLRSEDTYVSRSAMVNDCVPNALYMLKQAVVEWRSHRHNESADERAARMGFANAEEAIYAYSSKYTSTWAEALTDTTAMHPRCERMNVVLILTESWSGRLADYEQMYGLELLGAMRQHLDSGIYFRNFISSTNGTIHAIENICMGTVCENVFSSPRRHEDNPYSPARLYADNGYDTYFVTGISLGWRNLRDALPHQGFNHVVGRYEIMEACPGAECNSTWGVYDHSMLQYINYLLDSESDRPKFIVCLTSTSHMPFEFPANYPFAELRLGDKTHDAFVVSDDIAIGYLHGYQYESNELGLFMSRLKASASSTNTVVAITGDHNVRRILPYGDGTVNEEWHRYAVPLYIYAPVALDADTSRYGSHDDIIPTLANLTLSHVPFVSIGHNLLADSLSSSFAINADAGFVLGDADDKARKALKLY